MSTEASFTYNGPLSTYREAHSLLIGVAAGIPIGWSPTVRHEIRKEPHYALAGLLVGALTAFILQEWGD